jgi:hypothetical protein
LTTKAANAAGWDRRPKHHVRATVPPRCRDRQAQGQRVAPPGIVPDLDEGRHACVMDEEEVHEEGSEHC